VYRRILVGHDGSPLAARAARHALKLACAVGAAIEVVHVSAPFHLPPQAAESPFVDAMRRHAAASRTVARRALEPIARAARTAGVACRTHHLGGLPVASHLVAAAESLRCDLVVVASHGRDRVARVLLGSVAARLLELTDRPVLVVPAPSPRRAGRTGGDGAGAGRRLRGQP
jgi:nucleotide-binding universal stress UspA family protein